MTSLTAGLTITYHSCLLASVLLLPLIDSAQSTMKRSASYSFHTEEQGLPRPSPGTRVSSFNDTATHAEPRINADFDSSRLVGSSGLTVHSHMNRRDARWRDAQQWGHEEEGGSLSAPWSRVWPSKAEFLLYFDPNTAFGDIPLFRSCCYSILLFLNAQKKAFLSSPDVLILREAVVGTQLHSLVTTLNPIAITRTKDSL